MIITNKKVYFELMRIIAVTLVIFNHLSGYSLYMISSGFNQWIYMTITMITRINVPLFLMISGALLLQKEEDFKKVFKNRIVRFCLIILIFNAGLFILNHIHLSHPEKIYDLNLKNFLYEMLKGTVSGTDSYWFLYSYLGMLFMLPFLQRIAKKMEKQDFYVLIFLHFLVCSLIPIINILFYKMNVNNVTLNSNFEIPFVTMKVLFYPLLGYYLEHRIDIKKLCMKQIFFLIIIAFIGIMISNVCTYHMGISTGKYTQNYVQLFDYVTAIVVFVIIKYLVVKVSPKMIEERFSSVICFIGSLTFGIYLLDPYLKYCFYKRYDSLLGSLLPTFIVSIGWCFVSMILGGTITFILKKLPIFKKIL